MSPDRVEVRSQRLAHWKFTAAMMWGGINPWLPRIPRKSSLLGSLAGIGAAACMPQAPRVQEMPTPIIQVVTATPTETPPTVVPTLEPPPTPTQEPPPTATSTPVRREPTPAPPIVESARPFGQGRIYRSTLFEVKNQPEGDIAVSPVSSDQIFAFAVREASCADGSKKQIVTTFLIEPGSIVPDRHFSQTNQLGDLISAGAVPNGQLAGEVIFRDTPPTPNTPACKGKKLFFQAVLDQLKGRSGLGKIIGELYQRVRKGDNPPDAYIGLAEQYCGCTIPPESK